MIFENVCSLTSVEYHFVTIYKISCQNREGGSGRPFLLMASDLCWACCKVLFTEISQPLHRALQGQGDAGETNGPDFSDMSGSEALAISSEN